MDNAPSLFGRLGDSPVVLTPARRAYYIYYFKARFSLCLFSISFVTSLSAFFAANTEKMTEAQPTSVASLTTTSSKAEKENAQIKQTTLQLCIKDTPSLKRKSRTLTVKPGGKDFRRIGYSEFNTYALLQRSST